MEVDDLDAARPSTSAYIESFMYDYDSHQSYANTIHPSCSKCIQQLRRAKRIIEEHDGVRFCRTLMQQAGVHNEERQKEFLNLPRVYYANEQDVRMLCPPSVPQFIAGFDTEERDTVIPQSDYAKLWFVVWAAEHSRKYMDYCDSSLKVCMILPWKEAFQVDCGVDVDDEILTPLRFIWNYVSTDQTNAAGEPSRGVEWDDVLCTPEHLDEFLKSPNSMFPPQLDKQQFKKYYQGMPQARSFLPIWGLVKDKTANLDVSTIEACSFVLGTCKMVATNLIAAMDMDVAVESCLDLFIMDKRLVETNHVLLCWTLMEALACFHLQFRGSFIVYNYTVPAEGSFKDDYLRYQMQSLWTNIKDAWKFTGLVSATGFDYFRGKLVESAIQNVQEELRNATERNREYQAATRTNGDREPLIRLTDTLGSLRARQMPIKPFAFLGIQLEKMKKLYEFITGRKTIFEEPFQFAVDAGQIYTLMDLMKMETGPGRPRQALYTILGIPLISNTSTVQELIEAEAAKMSIWLMFWNQHMLRQGVVNKPKITITKATRQMFDEDMPAEDFAATNQPFRNPRVWSYTWYRQRASNVLMRVNEIMANSKNLRRVIQQTEVILSNRHDAYLMRQNIQVFQPSVDAAAPMSTSAPAPCFMGIKTRSRSEFKKPSRSLPVAEQLRPDSLCSRKVKQFLKNTFQIADTETKNKDLQELMQMLEQKYQHLTESSRGAVDAELNSLREEIDHIRGLNQEQQNFIHQTSQETEALRAANKTSQQSLKDSEATISTLQQEKQAAELQRRKLQGQTSTLTEERDDIIRQIRVLEAQVAAIQREKGELEVTIGEARRKNTELFRERETLSNTTKLTKQTITSERERNAELSRELDASKLRIRELENGLKEKETAISEAKETLEARQSQQALLNEKHDELIEKIARIVQLEGKNEALEDAMKRLEEQTKVYQTNSGAAGKENEKLKTDQAKMEQQMAALKRELANARSTLENEKGTYEKAYAELGIVQESNQGLRMELVAQKHRERALEQQLQSLNTKLATQTEGGAQTQCLQDLLDANTSLTNALMDVSKRVDHQSAASDAEVSGDDCLVQLCDLQNQLISSIYAVSHARDAVQQGKLKEAQEQSQDAADRLGQFVASSRDASRDGDSDDGDFHSMRGDDVSSLSSSEQGEPSSGVQQDDSCLAELLNAHQMLLDSSQLLCKTRYAKAVEEVATITETLQRAIQTLELSDTTEALAILNSIDELGEKYGVDEELRALRELLGQKKRLSEARHNDIIARLESIQTQIDVAEETRASELEMNQRDTDLIQSLRDRIGDLEGKLQEQDSCNQVLVRQLNDVLTHTQLVAKKTRSERYLESIQEALRRSNTSRLTQDEQQLIEQYSDQLARMKAQKFQEAKDKIRDKIRQLRGAKMSVVAGPLLIGVSPEMGVENDAAMASYLEIVLKYATESDSVMLEELMEVTSLDRAREIWRRSHAFNYPKMEQIVDHFMNWKKDHPGISCDFVEDNFNTYAFNRASPASDWFALCENYRVRVGGEHFKGITSDEPPVKAQAYCSYIQDYIDRRQLVERSQLDALRTLRVEVQSIIESANSLSPEGVARDTVVDKLQKALNALPDAVESAPQAYSPSGVGNVEGSYSDDRAQELIRVRSQIEDALSRVTARASYTDQEYYSTLEALRQLYAFVQDECEACGEMGYFRRYMSEIEQIEEKQQLVRKAIDLADAWDKYKKVNRKLDARVQWRLRNKIMGGDETCIVFQPAIVSVLQQGISLILEHMNVSLLNQSSNNGTIPKAHNHWGTKYDRYDQTFSLSSNVKSLKQLEKEWSFVKEATHTITISPQDFLCRKVEEKSGEPPIIYNLMVSLCSTLLNQHAFDKGRGYTPLGMESVYRNRSMEAINAALGYGVFRVKREWYTETNEDEQVVVWSHKSVFVRKPSRNLADSLKRTGGVVEHQLLSGKSTGLVYFNAAPPPNKMQRLR